MVVMRRLDESRTLERAIQGTTSHLEDRPAAALIHSIGTPIRLLAEDVQRRDWWLSLAYNRRVLLDPRLGLPCGLVRIWTGRANSCRHGSRRSRTDP
jgi:hypothetical protein